MKKLAFLLTAVVTIALTSSVYGQSTTGTTPAPGATHTYSVTNTTTSTYSWKVYKGTIATEVDATDVGIESITVNDPTNSVTIEWSTSAVVNTEYLIVVEETDGNGCKNTKALPVKITSVFDLVASTDSPADCYDGSVEVAWTGGQTGSSVTYDHGTATLTYKVTPTGVGPAETWSFEPSFNLAANFTQSSLTVSGATTGSVSPDGNGDYTFTGMEVVTITIVVDNGNLYDNDSDAAAQDFSLTMTLNDVAVSSNAIETLGTNNTADISVSRPHTSDISAN